MKSTSLSSMAKGEQTLLKVNSKGEITQPFRVDTSQEKVRIVKAQFFKKVQFFFRGLTEKGKCKNNQALRQQLQKALQHKYGTNAGEKAAHHIDKIGTHPLEKTPLTCREVSCMMAFGKTLKHLEKGARTLRNHSDTQPYREGLKRALAFINQKLNPQATIPSTTDKQEAAHMLAEICPQQYKTHLKDGNLTLLQTLTHYLQEGVSHLEANGNPLPTWKTFPSDAFLYQALKKAQHYENNLLQTFPHSQTKPPLNTEWIQEELSPNKKTLEDFQNAPAPVQEQKTDINANLSPATPLETEPAQNLPLSDSLLNLSLEDIQQQETDINANLSPATPPETEHPTQPLDLSPEEDIQEKETDIDADLSPATTLETEYPTLSDSLLNLSLEDTQQQETDINANLSPATTLETEYPTLSDSLLNLSLEDIQQQETDINANLSLATTPETEHPSLSDSLLDLPFEDIQQQNTDINADLSPATTPETEPAQNLPLSDSLLNLSLEDTQQQETDINANLSPATTPETEHPTQPLDLSFEDIQEKETDIDADLSLDDTQETDIDANLSPNLSPEDDIQQQRLHAQRLNPDLPVQEQETDIDDDLSLDDTQETDIDADLPPITPKEELAARTRVTDV